MVSSDIKLVANAVGGKSARACDNCIKKRARWYCAADDAFLCQSCDSSVHSANPLARRHERVRLKTASIKSFDDEPPSVSRLRVSVPSWHQGFTRKARTPRAKKQAKTTDDENQPVIGRVNNNPLHLVPEIYSEECSHEENEEQLLYRVPIFDPFVAELCTSGNSNDGDGTVRDGVVNDGFGHHESKSLSDDFGMEMNHLQGFLPSEMDLAEFAADVESLLGKGLEDESFDMEGLGILESKECDRVKIEDQDVEEVGNIHHQVGLELIDIGREKFELNFDYDSPVGGEEEDCKTQIYGEGGSSMMMVNDFGSFDQDCKIDDSKKKMFLRLDYESIMSAWDDQKSPWTTGERPELDAGDCWPNCMGTCGTMHFYGDMGMMGGQAAAAAMADGGREARVSRYREKRRTRLFSKKIRYEVRKLNAEKRPRMKGRFVKRANLVSPTAFPLLNKQ